jgi:hypothetical protein
MPVELEIALLGTFAAAVFLIADATWPLIF